MRIQEWDYKAVDEVQRKNMSGWSGPRAKGSSGDNKVNARQKIVNEWLMRKILGLGVVPPPVGLSEGLGQDDDCTDAIRSEPGDEGCKHNRWK